MVDQNTIVQHNPFWRMAAVFDTLPANTTTPVSAAGKTLASPDPRMVGVKTTAVDISAARVEVAGRNLGLSPTKIRISRGRGKAI